MNHVLLITIDSLRADHVGYHGYERDTTPNLDRLADSGASFLNAFAHVGGTRMSFPSILTSVYPQMYGGYERVADEQTVVAEVFNDAGYETAGFHSNLYLSAEFGYDRGFDRFFDSREDRSLVSKARQYVKTNLQDTPVFPVLKRAYDYLESSGGVNVGAYHVPADDITDMAIEHIQAADPDTPQFLWVHYMDVHHPFLPPEDYQRQFREEPISDRDSIKLRRRLIEDPESFDEADYQAVMDLYDAEIRYNDAEVGRLIEAATDAWGDLTTAVTADHGEHFLERGYFSGAQLYDVKLHVPLLIDGQDYDGTYEELVGLVDLPPTLVDLAELQIPDNFHGRSLKPLLESGTWDRTDVIGGLGLGEPPDYMCRTAEWKHIERADGSGNELYDLQTDPEEQSNVLSEHDAIVADLQERIAVHKDRVRATETAVGAVDMDENVRERLRLLGYDE